MALNPTTNIASADPTPFTSHLRNHEIVADRGPPEAPVLRSMRLAAVHCLSDGKG
jgi:hypothetical protein